MSVLERPLAATILNYRANICGFEALKATTVPGALFDHCEAEMKEIMLDARRAWHGREQDPRQVPFWGFLHGVSGHSLRPQTSGRVAKMAVDWPTCRVVCCLFARMRRCTSVLAASAHIAKSRARAWKDGESLGGLGTLPGATFSSFVVEANSQSFAQHVEARDLLISAILVLFGHLVDPLVSPAVLRLSLSALYFCVYDPRSCCHHTAV